MHREILQLSDSKIEVDHKDGNGLNNQRGNIRPATHRQNMANMRPYKNCASEFKGVHWNPTLQKWRARLRKDGKLLHLGYFINESDAALAYNLKAKEVYGEFAYLNKTA